MKNHLENPKNMIEMKFLLLEQKFIELISKGNRMNALKVRKLFMNLIKCKVKVFIEKATKIEYMNVNKVSHLYV